MGKISSRKLVTIPRGVVWALVEKGDFNIKRRAIFNKSLLCKLTFKVSATESFVYTFLHSCFLWRGSIVKRTVKRTFVYSSVWNSIKDSYLVVHESCQCLP